MKKEEHPLLESLIAEYGDSTNTGARFFTFVISEILNRVIDLSKFPAWTATGYKIWRHDMTGGAIGYIDSHGKQY